MKILFVGNYDSLSSGIMERLRQEENDIYFLTDNAGKLSAKIKHAYRYYEMGSGETMENIYASVQPDVVIFEGFDYMKAEWTSEQSGCFSLLADNLEEVLHANVGMFLFLSSTEVYGVEKSVVAERSYLKPVTLKGRWMAQQEEMVDRYRKNNGLFAMILRLGQVFSNEICLDSQNYFATLREDIVQENVITNEDIQPIHVSDVADAIVRLIEKRWEGVYNVCGSVTLQKGNVAKKIAKVEILDKEPIVEEVAYHVNVDNSKIKKTVEWTDFWNIDELLGHGKICFTHAEKLAGTGKKKRRFSLRNKGMKCLVSALIFAMALGVFVLCKNIPVFAQVPWLLVGVTMIALLCGVRCGSLAAILASMAHIIIDCINRPEMVSLQDCTQYLLAVAGYVFFGVVIGYTVDGLREELRIKRQDAKDLKKAYESLSAINEQNNLIKSEYEKRILNAKNSIPKLYSIIQKIDVLESDRIFMEILHVIEDMMGTDTVAVYKAKTGGRYLRLISALNEESLLQKRSVDLEAHPYIKKAVLNNEMYEGDVWKKQPALVLPVSIAGECKAVIIIKEIPMEHMSLYHINMVRTLLLLTSRSLERAFQYDEAVREEKYVKNTDILFPAEFIKMVSFAKEKKDREFGDYSILKIVPKESMVDEYHKLESYFRNVDVWGMDWDKNVYVLLTNTSEEEAQMAMERLKKRNIDVTIVKEINLGE